MPSPIAVRDPGGPRGLVVYSRLVSSEDYTADGGRFDLFLLEVPSGKVTRLTDHQSTPTLNLGGAIRRPAFSHDGKRILFLTDYASSDDRRKTMTGAAPYPDSFLNVWQLALRTREVTPVTRGDLGWNVFGWSPNDRFFCAKYLSRAGSLDSPATPDDLYVWDTATLKGRRIARVANGIEDAYWSADGSRIIYRSDPSKHLFAIPRVGGRSKTYVQPEAEMLGYVYSTDGKKVAYTGSGTVYVSGRGGKSKPLYKLVETPNGASTFDGPPIWSKDGRWLIIKTKYVGGTKVRDPVTGWYAFQRNGLVAVRIADGHAVVLKEPNEETRGLDWHETD